MALMSVAQLEENLIMLTYESIVAANASSQKAKPLNVFAKKRRGGGSCDDCKDVIIWIAFCSKMQNQSKRKRNLHNMEVRMLKSNKYKRIKHKLKCWNHYCKWHSLMENLMAQKNKNKIVKKKLAH